MMKRLLVTLLLTLLMATGAWAGQRTIGNTDDAVVTTGAGFLNKIIIHTDATNDVTFNIYDHTTAASGNKLFSTWTVTTSSEERFSVLTFDDEECLYVNGIYVTVSTQGTVTYDVFFSSK